jgi:hypothetical protein
VTLFLGRAQLDTLVSVRHSGDNVDIDFEIDDETTGGNLDHAKWLRGQVLGMVNNEDENAFPVRWTDDPNLDGVYTVRSASIDPVGNWLNHGFMSGSISLSRVPGGYAYARIETAAFAVTRPNIFGITGNAIAAWYDSSHPQITDLIAAPFNSSGTFSGRPSEDSLGGNSVPVKMIPGATATPVAYSTWLSSSLFYVASTRIEVQIGGVWRVLVGRQVPVGCEVWRISNGTFRLTVANGGAAGKVEIWSASPAAWQAINIAHTFGGGIGIEIGNVNPAVSTIKPPPTILRNGPDVVTVRSYRQAGYIDYTLRRSAQAVEMYSSGGGIGIAAAAATVCFAYTAGMVANADDANGNRIVLAGTTAQTNNLTTGQLHFTASGATSFMAGIYKPTNLWSYAATIDEWIGVSPLRQRVVIR